MRMRKKEGGRKRERERGNILSRLFVWVVARRRARSEASLPELTKKTTDSSEGRVERRAWE